MKTLAQLLDEVELPSLRGPEAGPTASTTDVDQLHDMLLHELGADLPAGHLHLWGGPDGAGKTAFVLSLLHGAASLGKRVLYATYDMPASTLARRLLAMVARVPVDALPEGNNPTALSPEAIARLHRARAALRELPFAFMEARGFGVDAIADRVMRLSQRLDVCAIDYVQGIVRPRNQNLAGALQDLSAFATRLHLAVLCTVRAGVDGNGDDLHRVEAFSKATSDRIGWLDAAVEQASDHAREARVVHNRFGACPSVPLQLDQATGALRHPDEFGA